MSKQTTELQEKLESIFCSAYGEAVTELHKTIEVLEEKLDNIFWLASGKAVEVLNSAQICSNTNKGETK